MNENPTKLVEIYSFNSSALLNIVSIKCLSLFYVYDDVMYDLHKIFYDLVSNKFQIQCIKID